jgi:hypothetical protein
VRADDKGRAEFDPPRNDESMNATIAEWSLAWLANTDARPPVDRERTVQYVAK